jgi:hypothetical protein
LNKKRYNYEIKRILWEQNRDCAECLKYAVNFFVLIYKMNF